ncbi:type II toxin-antitoxin system RelE/ParE family toxin [Luteolibacter yonseiensis]|uniref:Type II toxin-antitoxin system RelE/ParE family toxin n=1 Tax=Luteolibacter yonseiensis TaxID=1144680 RepID=A0A934R5F8_9BACT|nr:type II toxin-antitoxin system RelE/ParE family toxin [Luteolibacter yonseiensis]MBK1815509.1 type II toxin-antitoxin system RelE/ParE family toxin [Luteolibacter yonseiensis]
MTIRFIDEALEEFLDAISYYEEAGSGLGERFQNEVDRCVSSIAARPEIYRIRSGTHRRINLRMFPYYIPYVIKNEILWVLAVAHSSRRPSYWISRRKPVD